MSASDPEHKTQRYRLGELLRDATDHILLLTATPHKGDPENFSFFLQLLDADVFADVKSIREAMERRRAPFYLRRTKEAMVYFPHREPDGSWACRKIFMKRIPHTADFRIDGAEFELYREITRFVKRESAKAAAAGDDPRARAISFLMSLYQRRLASSTFALRRSLENRARRLDEALKRAQDVVKLLPTDFAIPGRRRDGGNGRRRPRAAWRINSRRSASPGTQSKSAKKSRNSKSSPSAPQSWRRGPRKRSAGSSKNCLKPKASSPILPSGYSSSRNSKTPSTYIMGRLRDWGFKVGCIHGGMKTGSRDEENTRLWTEQQFREGAIQVLVATEAAGEGINLQVCHILFNYDIPWNPNRLEQRMGRIHRYGQTEDCLIFNFVATNTIEGQVLRKLLEKLQEIRNALDDDSVFNVVGEVLPATHVERVLRDYYAGKMGDADLEDRLLRNVEEDHFRSICQNALEGLATKNLNLKC